MAKFPSQRKILYESAAISQDLVTNVGKSNLPKDLSLLNRRGYASTTRKGVPLVYKCKIDFYGQDDTGAGAAGGLMTSNDFQGTLFIDGCQNNWVMRNAAVKFHAAREKMFEKAGIRKADRGAYSHEIRYNYDSNANTWLVPVDGDGDAFTGGTWDATEISTERDQALALKLVGAGVDEDSAVSATALQIGFSYLSSRGQVPADSNLETSASPALFSVLHNMLMDSTMADGTKDNIVDEAQDAQDNPPYDEWTAADTNHDITEPVELGRVVLSQGNLHGSCIVEVPFGIMDLKARVYDTDAATTATPIVCVGVEVLDIFEMQG